MIAAAERCAESIEQGRSENVSHAVRRAAADEVSLTELTTIIWRRKWIILLVALCVAAVGGGISLLLPDVYRSQVLLAPTGADPTAGISRLGQLGGLAGLAGVSLSGGQTDKTTLALAVLQSRAFLTEVAVKHRWQVPLMATLEWDRERKLLIYNDEIYDADSGSWRIDADSGQSYEPSAWDIHKQLIRHIEVDLDKKTGLVTLAVEHQSPAIAAEWVSTLVTELNDEMRRLDVSEAQRSIDYLKKQLAKTDIAEIHNIFFELVEEQIKTVMLAEVRSEYVFKTVDPAITPEERDKPRRVLVTALAFVLGALVAIFASLVFGVRRLQQMA